MLLRRHAGHDRLDGLLTMFLVGVLCFLLAVTGLGLAMIQTAVLEAIHVQQKIIETQTFYTAETGLALLRRTVVDHFDQAMDAARGGRFDGPVGCFPVACGPRSPGYRTWALEAGKEDLWLFSDARTPSPVPAEPCREGIGTVIRQRIHREKIQDKDEYTFTASLWSSTACRSTP